MIGWVANATAETVDAVGTVVSASRAGTLAAATTKPLVASVVPFAVKVKFAISATLSVRSVKVTTPAIAVANVVPLSAPTPVVSAAVTTSTFEIATLPAASAT
jgi:hypothetical protein